jgi:enamine deaminase RidA (YjgF/YER057c/UK114 family)
MEVASMTLELINPAGLSAPANYSQVAVATGSRLVFVAGQVADNEQGDLVGPGDLTVQASQAFANVGRALAAVGARPDQVARITIYVVHHRPEYLPVISEARVAVFGDHKPTDVVLGVEALAHPELLIEVDAIAVVD